MIVAGKHERDDLQCVVVENDLQCIHGVRNVKRMLCSMHYARWQRSGCVDLVLPNGGSQTKLAKETELERRERLIIASGGSTICICSHTFKKHYVNSRCRTQNCNCWKFESTNPTLVKEVKGKMRALNFSNPLNDTALCGYCNEYIHVGTWHDNMIISRIRQHLRLQHLERRIRRAG